MNGSGVKVLSTQLGCVMLKPDWYRAFCKEVTVPESLQIILIE